jgi:hypothetical protein
MEIKSKRHSLIRIARLWLDQGDTSPAEYNIHLQKISGMSDAEVNSRIAELTAAVSKKPVNKKTFFKEEDKILKEFDSRGETKNDYVTADTKTVKPEKKKEFSNRAKMKAIAAKINSSKSPELKQISEQLGSLNLWSYKNVDLVFENLNEFKN